MKSYSAQDTKDEQTFPGPNMSGNIKSTPSNVEELTKYEINIMTNFLVGFPKFGRNWPLKIPFPRSLISQYLFEADLAEDIKVDIERSVVKGDGESYVKSVEANISTKIMSYPRTEEYIDDLRPTSDLERARLGAISHILASLQIVLSSFLMRDGSPPPIDDIFGVLKDPGQVREMTPIAEYIYAGVRNELIIPLFGSVEKFYNNFVRLRKQSNGFIEGLKNLRFDEVSENQIRKLFDQNDIFQSFITLFVSLVPHIDDMMDILSLDIFQESYVPRTGKNPAKVDEDDPVIKLVLG